MLYVNLLDDVIVCFELLLVDVCVELDVFVPDPLLRRDREDVVTADDLETHPGEVVHAELDVRHP